jgi:23S rRNA (adenine2503-C2)-methyltransferase
MAVNKSLIHDLSYTELENYLISLGEPAYRAKQIWVALYKNYKNDVHEITTLSMALREKLADSLSFTALTPVRTIKSRDSLTIKTLFKLHDDCLIEAVLMVYDQRNTVCISSQSGCGLGCSFCATGQMGLSRNLSSGEIVTQVLYFARILAEKGERITNVVIMGMGEPFQNYEQVIAAIDRLNNPEGFGLGARRITLSTVGIVPKIKQFADADSQVNLAISLHSVNDEIRNQLVPINQKYPVADLLEACRYYIKHTKRRVTFEYALIDGVNDSEQDATALVQQIKGMLCHVNLIPLNPTKGFSRQGSQMYQVKVFKDILDAAQIPCTVRLRRGIEIGAGCGQLAAEGM